MIRNILALALLCVCMSEASSAPILLYIDNTHSSVQFSVPFVGVTEVNGSFERFCGIFYYDESDVSKSKLELFIDASSVNTGLRIRDKDLRNDYLEIEKYPMIYFKSTAVSSPAPKTFDVTGELNLHGKIQSIWMRMSLLAEKVNGEGGKELGLKLQPIVLFRKDYEIMTKSIGTGSVGDSITVHAVIRLRDVSVYRKDLDSKYPDTKEQSRVTPGKYEGANGKTILLLNYGSRSFMAFIDDWTWLSELKSIGPATYKCASFGNRIEVRGDELVLTNDKGSEVLKKSP